MLHQVKAIDLLLVEYNGFFKTKDEEKVSQRRNSQKKIVYNFTLNAKLSHFLCSKQVIINNSAHII